MAIQTVGPLSTTDSEDGQQRRLAEQSAFEDTNSKDYGAGCHLEKQQTEPVEQEAISTLRLILIAGSMSLVCFLALLDTSIVGIAIPRITDQFHSLADVGWYGAAYQLASASLIPLSGKLYTHLSSKWVFLAHFALFELGSLLCAVATSSTRLIVGRAVAGMGSAGLMNGGMTIITAAAPGKQLATMLATMISVGQLGLASGPLIGGVLTQRVSWRWCFYINLPIGGLVAVLILFLHIPEQVNKERLALRTLVKKLDPLGFAIFTPTSIIFFLALELGGNQFSWNSPTIIGLFAGAGVATIIFLILEWRIGEDAMLPYSMLAKRILWSSGLTMLFFQSAVFAPTYYLPIYFQSVKGASPIGAGVDVLPSILMQIVVQMATGALMPKVGYYLPFILVSCALTSISAGLFSLLAPDTSTARWAGYQILAGAGRGAGQIVPMMALRHLLPPSQIAIGMSVLVFCQSFGSATLLAVAETDFINSLRSLIPKYAPGVNVEAIVGAAATGFRSVVSSDQLAGVIRAYSSSVDRVFYIGVGTSICAFVCAWGMGWVDIREKKASDREDEQDG